MNPFEMVAIIVVAVMIATVIKARSHGRAARRPEDDLESLRLREEVKALKERLHVLERIATDKENSLAREIDELRDR
jgi:hypothetical protein